ncbi:MAG TPA: hypothetical protein VHN79_11050, partial [Lacunisphaera sp.]|nr:hypothetical protein [Lacunisphaera sp.]
SKLERGKEEPSERVRLKVEKIEREQGIHISDPRFTSPRLKVGELPISATGEPPDRYGAVALLKPQQRAPSTRADCEIFVQHLLDAAEASGDPNAWPVILHRLKKQFSFDEWDDRPSPE